MFTTTSILRKFVRSQVLRNTLWHLKVVPSTVCRPKPALTFPSYNNLKKILNLDQIDKKNTVKQNLEPCKKPVERSVDFIRAWSP